MHRFRSASCILTITTPLAFASIGGGVANAQFVELPIANPRVLGVSPELQGLGMPTGRLPHERPLELNVVYTDGYIRNPATGRDDKVRLRSYNGTDVDPKTPYVSPTVDVKPGDTVRITLKNDLPADPGCAHGHTEANEPHCFNGTNLHTHGLWVNPAGNGDNVLLSINPGVTFQYEYNIPSDHPAGTFWYHTHRHGSTALQVSSGMAGALIVRGDRLPNATDQGDLDTLLEGFNERVMVFQQIQYACREPGSDGNAGPIKKNPDGTYRCDPEDVGTIENYDLFGPRAWERSGRYTSINGVVIPTFKTKVGDLERWRMIHGGVRDTISLKLVKMEATAQLASTFTKGMAADFMQQSCTGAVVPQTLVAADGLTLAKAQTSELTTFQPGYRFDAILTFPEEGRYCVINTSAPSAGSVNGEPAGPEMLAIIDVAPGTPVSDTNAYVTGALVDKAQTILSGEIAASVVADLRDGLKLSRFTTHPDIGDKEVTGNQDLTFFIDTSTNPLGFKVSNTASSAQAASYEPDRIDRKLVLGDVDEWTLRSELASHPFHIHVNPFQIVAVIDPKGRDVSVAGAIDDAHGDVDPQYAGLKGVWKDTIWVKNAGGGVAGVYKVIVRTRYERYIGQFVLHCHILDHEDQGMMQNVEIILPQGDMTVGAAEAETHKH